MVDKSKMFLGTRMMGMMNVSTQSTLSKPVKLSMTKVSRYSIPKIMNAANFTV